MIINNINYLLLFMASRFSLIKQLISYIYTLDIPKTAIELEGYYTWMGDDGIARTRVKPNVDITLDYALANTKVVTAFFVDKKFPILIDSRGIKSMSYEARRHFSARGRDSKTNAFGIIIGSNISRVLGNFYLGVNKPAVPTKLFDNESEAIAWLTQFVNQ